MEYTLSDGKCWACTKNEGNTTEAASTVLSQGAGVVGDSSQRAIDVLRTVNQINYICGVILALVTFFISIEYYDSPVAGLLFAAVVVLVSSVAWAVVRVFVGIAEDIKGIRQKLEKD